MIWNKISVGIAMVVVVALAAAAIWFIIFKTPTTPTTTPTSTTQNSQSFSTSNTNTTTQGGDTQTVTNGQVGNQAPQQKIFKLADGPIEDATFVQTANPTTTLARYVMQDSGHVLDIPVDVPGAVARVVSNTTIPGLGSALWFAKGIATIVQYPEKGVVKTVYLGLPTGVATSSIKVRFLPDTIVSLATSPDGKSVVYLVPAGSGTSGYVAKADGSSPVKLFSSPLSQLLISWPSATTLLLQTKEAAGVPGIAFSVSAQTGTMTPLVYANSLSATANAAFSKLVYQTAGAGSVRTTYSHDVKSGKDLELPFNPLPEKCAWSTHPTLLYCAAPLTSAPSNYLDLWHQGILNAADSIFAFDIGSGVTSLVALPGSKQGGTQSNMATVHISPDGQYLLFVTKGDRSLWGVRLAP